MSRRLETTRRFEKDFRRLPSGLKQRIDGQVRILEDHPYAGKRRSAGRYQLSPWN